MYIREEFNRQNGVERPELTYLEYFKSLFIQIRYYTPYATEKYSKMKKKNQEFLEHRIENLSEEKKDKKEKKEKGKSSTDELVLLSNKETEDLFKIAFRNYNHLISVADSKASLLINVNSIIISVMIAFVLGKIDKLFFILWPTIILLAVCLGTILLAILASRPQSNSFLENRSSLSYQRFFFGSFDLVDPEFNRVEWDEYYKHLVELFSNQKDRVYMEIYKESFNVRKVLVRKFNYLSKAYWVFLFGLLISVIAFVISIYNNR
jgi:ABC-type multidrug transport system fused ATPase/permease subunit